MNIDNNEEYENYITNETNMNDITPQDINKYTAREEYADELAGTYESEDSYGDNLLDSTASAYENNDTLDYENAQK